MTLILDPEKINIRAPRDNLALYGHEAPEQRLLQMVERRLLPHALLITGPHGIGKSTLAYRIGRYLLSYDGAKGGGLFGDLPETSMVLDEHHPIIRRVTAQSHPDLLVLEPDFDEKKQEFKSEIPVDKARKVGEFLSLTPAESKWRVVIIDSADELNRNAANALLKVLEEPPANAILLLVSHNPRRLLPTIRSRCQVLALKSLSREAFTRVLHDWGVDLSPDDIVPLAELSCYSPGLARDLITHGAAKFYQEMMELLRAFPNTGTLEIQEFVEGWSKRDEGNKWKTFMYLFDLMLHRISTFQSAPPLFEVFQGERELLGRLAAARGLDYWMKLWEKANSLAVDVPHLHLDQKMTMWQMLEALQDESLLAA